MKQTEKNSIIQGLFIVGFSILGFWLAFSQSNMYRPDWLFFVGLMSPAIGYILGNLYLKKKDKLAQKNTNVLDGILLAILIIVVFLLFLFLIASDVFRGFV